MKAAAASPPPEPSELVELLRELADTYACWLTGQEGAANRLRDSKATTLILHAADGLEDAQARIRVLTQDNKDLAKQLDATVEDLGQQLDATARELAAVRSSKPDHETTAVRLAVAYGEAFGALYGALHLVVDDLTQEGQPGANRALGRSLGELLQAHSNPPGKALDQEPSP